LPQFFFASYHNFYLLYQTQKRLAGEFQPLLAKGEWHFRKISAMHKREKHETRFPHGRLRTGKKKEQQPLLP
jgi:hypothetical protein